MKFYKTQFENRQGEVTFFWETNRDRAALRLRQMRRAVGLPAQTDNERIEELEVPSGRIELLAWLNRHATRA